jgi:hypothetical protein
LKNRRDREIKSSIS